MIRFAFSTPRSASSSPREKGLANTLYNSSSAIVHLLAGPSGSLATTQAQIQTRLAGILEGSASNLLERSLTLHSGVSGTRQAHGHITVQSHA